MNEKFKGWLQNYFYTFVAIGITFIYVFRGFVTFDRTGKTVWEIIADGIIILLLGIVIDFLFGAQGIRIGKNVGQVVRAEERHAELLQRVGKHSDKLQRFCDKKNADALNVVRQQILLSYGYLYDDFFNPDGTVKPFPTIPNEEKKDRKRRYKAYRTARDFKVTMLTVSMLTSDTSGKRDPNAMGRSVTRFLFGQTRNDVASKIGFSLFWGLYGIQILRDISWENLIGTSLQAAMLLGIGTMKLITSKLYITGEYRERIETKNRLMEEFEMYLEREKGEKSNEKCKTELG